MDAVELPLPAAVAVSKLMGSEGCGGAGVAVKEVEACESKRVSILVRPSIDTCSSFRSPKDDLCTINASESDLWKDLELRRPASQLSSFHGNDGSEVLNYGSTSSSVVLMPGLEAKKFQRKAGKVARGNGGCSKRSRMAQMEVSINGTGAVDIKGTSNELGSYSAKCNIAEKSRMVKQKNNINGKRGDKRNGVCGSKPDIYDVTKHVDELSLNELLDGSYKCPGFAKDKGKKAANLNENILHSVREACSILRLQKPIQPHSFAEDDNSYDQKVSTCLVSSGSSVASRSHDDKGDSYAGDLSSCNKVQDSCCKLKTPADIPYFPMYQPKDILERLALPPPKDLESLLLDAAKPVVSSRNNPDLRLCKPVSLRGGLPPFPWSHTSSGHCKSNLDAVKFSAGRISCQGKWVKIGIPATSLGGIAGFLGDLESLTYDRSLVPSGGKKLGPPEHENAPSTSVSFTSCEKSLLSSATCSIASQVLPAGHSPRLLAAAQTLYEIATHSLKQNPHGMIRWPKKPSQKAMKACKLKSNEKCEAIFAAPKSAMGPDSLVKAAEDLLPSKKLRLSVNERSDDSHHTNTMRKGPINWSTPRSSRSSPSKSFKDPAVETKHYNGNIVKKSCTMPPSARVLDKACNSQQKLRKLMPMEWNRAGGKLD